MTPEAEIEQAIRDASRQAEDNLTRVVMLLSIQAKLLQDIDGGGNREALLREIGTQALDIWGNGYELDELTERLAAGMGVTITWHRPAPVKR